MRDAEFRLDKNGLTEEQNIQIDSPRTVSFCGGHTPNLDLEGLQLRHQLLWIQQRLPADHHIQER